MSMTSERTREDMAQIFLCSFIGHIINGNEKYLPFVMPIVSEAIKYKRGELSHYTIDRKIFHEVCLLNDICGNFLLVIDPENIEISDWNSILTLIQEYNPNTLKLPVALTTKNESSQEDREIAIRLDERKRAKKIAYQFFEDYTKQYENRIESEKKLKVINSIAFVDRERADIARQIGNAISGHNALSQTLKISDEDIIKQDLKSGLDGYGQI